MTEQSEGDSIRESNVDGVPIFWTDSARRVAGAIEFRVGRSDEPFPSMGISHVVEHLALFKVGRRPYTVNGFVDHFRTVFFAHGSLDEVVGFFGDVVDALKDLPLDRLADEGRILRTEAMRREVSLSDQLLWYRYGARGVGSLGLLEYGIGSFEPEAVSGWAARHFVAANAAAWISGPVPESLRVDLPAGEHRPIASPIPLDPLPLPAWVSMPLPGISVGIVVPRRSSAAMGLRILTKRLEQRLRYDLGRSYEISLAYLPLDAEIAHGSIFASCLEAEASDVRDHLVAVLETFAQSGPTVVELTEDIDAFRRMTDDPDAILGELEQHAVNTLMRHPVLARQALFEEMEAVTPESARDDFAAALDGSIMCGPVADPPGGSAGSRWTPYPLWSAGAVIGRRFDAVSRRFPWTPRTEQLIVGDDGVSWLNHEGRGSTVRFADTVGVLTDGGGTRTLYGVDGFRVRVIASAWRNGSTAVAAIDAAIPRDLFVKVDPA